jgi:hypothetical protein
MAQRFIVFIGQLFQIFGHLPRDGAAAAFVNISEIHDEKGSRKKKGDRFSWRPAVEGPANYRFAFFCSLRNFSGH